uniref:glycerophosphoinositol inositolphosphodiesterase GDPD2-like isoform X1 n=1 Tax=Doryrhamphus excisus TaxID=161450 RepID=UPI0025ADC82C|nr:glycerophosphoinositol inositolphosphodiesterase GDPD2-like isoform X1 [Doryrhamphus excisus]XP_057911404.1 glycerophosphoinositol inositolphosphodiesterase GDPD2-like isoform X1 [Doryrhamphus excisus]XP_057911415.1 glycerophosphoinositol inositolphosphodiesterase GDPD2-like isoform X1 [Doryrhamphus excisus]XP_057911426.1 glycerophosphoinositol inositolphosphodiesterase GDPD2-like isoform X1 [Doryrhamphus excisus]XP_057911437.1 glycerophosphoinositol inositolphosphodiesterase GDPD2-like isof
MSAFTACCRACSRGLYSCRWKRSRKGEESQCACWWFSVVALVTLLAVSWMYVCLVTSNDQEDVNWKGFVKLKRWVNWVVVLITTSAVLTSYCVLLLLFALFHIALKEPLHLHWLHKFLLFLGLLFISVGVIGISLQWKREWPTVLLSLQATAPFLQLGAVWALVLLSPLVFQGCQAAKTKPGPREHHHVLPKEHRMRRDGLRDGRAAQGSHGNPISIQACLLWPANPRAHIDKHPFPPTFIPTDNLEWPMKLACFWNFSMHVLQGAKLLSVSQRQGTADMLALDASAGAALIGGRDWRFKASIAHIDTVLLH